MRCWFGPTIPASRVQFIENAPYDSDAYVNSWTGSVTMHELSLAYNLKEILLERCGNSTVVEVEIEVGSLSGVIPETLEFCANMVLAETFGDGVRIVLTHKNAMVSCTCGQEYELEDILDPCPLCKGYNRVIIDGTDIILKSVEVESK